MRRCNTVVPQVRRRCALACVISIVGAEALQAASDGAQSAPVATLPSAAVRLTQMSDDNAVGEVVVSVVAAGSEESNLFLLCSIPSTAAAFSIIGGGSRNIGGPAVLGPNDPPIRVRCTPQAALLSASMSCEQRVSVGDQPSPLSVAVECPAAEPALIELTPKLDFGAVPAGQQSFRWVEIANRASRPATIAECRFEGNDAADFELTDYVDFHPNPSFAPRFPLTIPAGFATQLPIRFDARAPLGAKTARFLCQGAAGTTVNGDTVVQGTVTSGAGVSVNALSSVGLIVLACGVLLIGLGLRRFG